MKILMISNHLGVQSGVQRYVQNLLLHLDTAKYRVTLFVGQCPPDQASTAPALEAHGVEILAVPDNKKDRIRALAAHLRTHKDYDIIHYHTASKIGAPVCGMMRVLCPRAKIVVHSHIVYPPMTLTWRAAHLVYQLFADYFLGCGVAAGRFVFGDHIDAKPNFSVACNAVDAGRFHPDAAARAATRAAWGITDTDRLAGFVGRLNHQKNPLFLMEVFAAMAAQDPHWKLLLVGTGEMEPEMRAAAARRGLTDRVIFAGVQSDVPAFMNAFDLFLLPSNFEGSPVTLVEAQGCGVPCLASTNVPDDGSVTDLVHFLPLAAPLTDWAAKAEAIGRLVSLAFRSGIDVADVVGQLKGIGGEHPIFQKKGLLLSIPDAIAWVLENRYLKGRNPVPTHTVSAFDRQLCPDCGGELVFQEGCHRCPNCAYTKCGG